VYHRRRVRWLSGAAPVSEWCRIAVLLRWCGGAVFSGDLLRSWERGGAQPWEATVLGVANFFAFLRPCVG
jgi:hypothetical protein